MVEVEEFLQGANSKFRISRNSFLVIKWRVGWVWGGCWWGDFGALEEDVRGGCGACQHWRFNIFINFWRHSHWNIPQVCALQSPISCTHDWLYKSKIFFLISISSWGKFFLLSLQNLHKPSTQKNVEYLTIERWQKLQGKLKVIELLSGFVLSPLNDTKGRQIPLIKSWCSIVDGVDIDKNEKHLSFIMTTNVIFTQWSTNSYVRGIQTSFIQNCMNSCDVWQENKMCDEVVKVSLEDLSATIDVLCTKYIILGSRLRYRVGKTKTITYYRCHREHNKNRPHSRTVDVKPMDDKGSRWNRIPRLCSCEFQMKAEEPNVSRCSNTLHHSKLQATIYLHNKHSGHIPGFDSDLFFLLVHPYVIAWVMENLKFMLSSRAIEATSVEAQKRFSQSILEVERATYRFFVIKKKCKYLHIL